MKKILLILLLATGVLLAQNEQRTITDAGNSTTTVLVGGDIDSVLTYGSGDSITVSLSDTTTIPVGSMLSVGDIVTIAGTGDANYDTQHTILAVTDTSFLVAATYTADGTGTFGTHFIGTAKETVYLGNWASIGVSYYSVKADGDVATTTLKVLQGQDGSTWLDSTSYTVTDAVAKTINLPLSPYQYYQVVVINADTLQSTMLLETTLYVGVLDKTPVYEVLVDSSDVTTSSTTYYPTSLVGYTKAGIFISCDDSTTVTVYSALDASATLTDETTNYWGNEGTNILGAASVSDVQANYWIDTSYTTSWLLFKVVKVAKSGSSNDCKIAIMKGK